MLVVHNRYQQVGGEDRVFEAESDLLAARGHAVERLAFDNHAVDGMSRLSLAATTLWSREGRRAVEAAARAHRADVVHFHNTLPLISPAGYYGARAAGAAVVQTLHNYRRLCPGALLHRDGAPCELCVGKAFAWQGIRHACYRGSRAATLAVATMTSAHAAIGTWSRAVDRYIAITEFSQRKHQGDGFPADRVVLKYNTLGSDPGTGAHDGDAVVFVGRLTREKGVPTLLRAWTEHGRDLPPLVVVGTGDEEAAVRAAAEQTADGRRGAVRWAGWQPQDEIFRLLKESRLFVFPSEWYEGGTPIALVEALATGIPFVGTDLGASAEIVARTGAGLTYPAGDAAALADAVRRVTSSDDLWATLARASRRAFETHFAAGPNLDRLVEIYHEAMAVRAAAGR